MSRALMLAENGRGHVSPNPMVGCVIVCNDEIIGEGWHMAYGGPHAEVNAVNSVKDKELLKSATVYVTLEPCAHHGKTPPCAALLVSNQVNEVVIACIDPNPKVAGKGIQILNNAGIKVKTGVLEAQAIELNNRFFKFHHTNRPWVMLKWAETADGFIAKADYDSKWISGKLSRTLVHKWRAEEDAIMVGKNTAYHDNPSLNVRMWKGNNPVRIVTDSHLSLPENLNLFNQQQKTIVINTKMDESLTNLEYVKVNDPYNINEVLLQLYKRNIQSIIVEGGANLLERFIKQKAWDEARVFRCPVSFGEGIAAPALINGELKSTENINGDQLLTYKRAING